MPDDSDTIDLGAVLKDRLLAGDYLPGQRLTEMDLAAEFGLGRGRVREALRTLVGEGYLAFEANRGVVVRRYARAEMLEAGRLREVIEGLAARLAAEAAIPQDDRAALADLQERMNRAEADGDLAAFNDLNRAWHRLIARLGGSPALLTAMERIRLPLARLQLPRSFSADSMERSNRDHRVITMAILSGSPDAAEAAMRAHVRVGNAYFAALPPEALR